MEPPPAGGSRPLLVRVVIVTPRVARKGNASFESDGRIVMATARDTLATQLLALVKNDGDAELFPDLEQAGNIKRSGHSTSDFVNLYFGTHPELARPWSESWEVLCKGIGYKTAMIPGPGAGMKEVFDIVMRVSNPKKKNKVTTESDGMTERGDNTEKLEAINKRAYNAAMAHWPRDKDTGVLYTLAPSKNFPEFKQASKWHLDIAENVYRTTYTLLVKQKLGAHTKFGADSLDEFRRKLQK